MTALQQIREEGLQMGIIRGKKEGKKEGVQQGKKEIAKQMLADKMPINEVSKYTGLSLKELEKLAS